MVCPVHPAKLGHGVAHLQARCFCWAACHDTVDLCKGRLEGSRGCGGGTAGRHLWSRRVALRLLLKACVMLVQSLLDARHELFVVILEPYYASACRSYCAASLEKLSMAGRVSHTLRYVNVGAREAVKGSQGRGHGDPVL